VIYKRGRLEEPKIIKKELGESPLQRRDRKDDDKK
jgi:hypothetical protein